MGVAQVLGQTVVLQRKFDPVDWLRLVDKYKVTSTFSAPTPIRMICSLPAETKAKYDRSTMRRMIANAAPWSFALKQMYLADFPGDSLFEVYGSTELGVNTVLEPQDQLRKPGSCGKAAPGVEIVLFDDDGNVVTGTGPDNPGELYLRSAGVFADYYKQHDKYEADMRADYHTVGDVAYRDEEGYFYICDRKKDMIISGGMNIYPAEIEAALEQHPNIYDAAVFGVPSEEWGESVHAVVVVEPPGSLSDGRGDGPRPRASRRLQGASQRVVHGRAPAHGIGQDPQARAAPRPTGRAERHRSADCRGELAARRVDLGAAIRSNGCVHTQGPQSISEPEHACPRCAASRPPRRRVQRDQVHVRREAGGRARRARPRPSGDR